MMGSRYFCSCALPRWVGGSVLFLALLLLPLWSGAQPVRGPAALPQPGIDVQDYDFDLVLSDTTKRIEGTARVHVRITTDTLTAVRLDLIGPPGHSGDSGMEVLGVSEAGADIEYTHSNDLLRIRPSDGLSDGDVHHFRIEYAGVPADGLIIGTNRHGNRTFFGDNWPNRARHWLPVVDHLSDKATVSFRVTAPAEFEVVSNGALLSDSLSGDMRTTRWGTDVPLPTKVMVIGVADFVVDTVATIDGVPVQSWVYPEDRTVGFKDLGQAPPIVAFFEEKLGPYPYEKLANVQSATRYGGMENAAAIFYSEKSVADGRDSTPLLAHEIAHQWYGNTVTEADWPHLWLSEGFATYLTGLYLEHARGDAAFTKYMKQGRRQVRAFHEKRPDAPLVDTTFSDPNELLNTNPYQKGSWVLHMLRHEMGLETFWNGLRTYYERYRNQNAQTRDFRQVMEEVSGLDLKTFFEQWTRRPGHPVIEGQWRYDAEAEECVVSLRQTQSEPVFRISVDLSVQAETAQTETVTMNSRRVNRRIPCSQTPSAVALDPNTRLLGEFSMTQTE